MDLRLNSDDIFDNNSDDVITPKFTSELSNLNTDITYLDMQISSVQKHILALESTIAVIEQALNNPQNKNNPNFDKTKMYGVLNKTLEILSLYHSNQQRFLDLKHKYRKEQDDLKYKIVRMINIELEQFNRHNQSNMEVLETLRNFNFNDPNNKKKLLDEIESINSDPLYEY
jgi:hypothetical protein